LTGTLLDFGSFRPAPAREVVEALVDFVAPVLAEQGELDLVRAGVQRILARGTGSQQLRPPFREAGLCAVVDHAVRATTEEATEVPTAAANPSGQPA
jgi:carboxylate-amine ligase